MFTAKCFRILQVGSKYILFGGADAHQQHFDDVHCFDAATSTWEEVRSFAQCTVYVIEGINIIITEYRMRRRLGIRGVDLVIWRMSSCRPPPSILGDGCRDNVGSVGSRRLLWPSRPYACIYISRYNATKFATIQFFNFVHTLTRSWQEA